MAKTKKLTKKQLAVLDDLFIGELDEYAVLEKHNVKRNLYYRWLMDPIFEEEFSRRIAVLARQSAALIARFATVAAAKLVQLTESDNPETARKACLDIISLLDSRCSMPVASHERQETPARRSFSEGGSDLPPLSPATASRLLAALAEGNKTASLTQK